MTLLFFLLIGGLACTAQAQTSVSLGLRLGGNLAGRSGDDPTYIPPTSPSTFLIQELSYERKVIPAPQFGAVLNVSFGKLALQPAVLFSQKGARQHLKAVFQPDYGSPYANGSVTTDEYELLSRPNYLEVPLNVVYTTGGDDGFQVFAGPYVAFGVGGQAQLENETVASRPNSTFNSYSFGNAFMLYRDTYPGPQAPRTSSGSSSPAAFSSNSSVVVARRFDAGVNAGIGYRFGPWQVQAGYGWGFVNQQPGHAPNQTDDLTAYYQRVGQLTATYLLKTK